MSSFNRVIIAGNLTRDPEYKQLNNGQAVCRLGLASNRQFKNRQTGMMVQEVCYVDIDVWGPQAESCRQYLQKGRPILVEGRLKLDSWKDNEGNNRSKHSIVADRVIFLGTTNQTESSDVMNNQDGEYQRNSSLDKNILDQLDAMKKQPNDVVPSVADTSAPKRTSRKAKQEGKAEEGLPTIEFNDEPPFQDDLPF